MSLNTLASEGGIEEHYSMMVEDFNIITSPDSAVKYITFKEGPTKTRQGGLRVTHRAVQTKMFATGGERCYLLKLVLPATTTALSTTLQVQ